MFLLCGLWETFNVDAASGVTSGGMVLGWVCGCGKPVVGDLVVLAARIQI